MKKLTVFSSVYIAQIVIWLMLVLAIIQMDAVKDLFNCSSFELANNTHLPIIKSISQTRVVFALSLIERFFSPVLFLLKAINHDKK